MMRRLAIVLGAAALLSGTAIDAVRAEPVDYDSGGTGTSQRLLMDAGRAEYHGRLSEAIALCTRALDRSPNYGAAYERRATLYRETGRYKEAAADLDRVIAMHPDDMALAMSRVELALWQADGNGAKAALKDALNRPLRSVTHAPQEASTYEAGYGKHLEVNGHMESRADMYASIADQLLHQDDASIADMQAMMRVERQHPEHILADYCYIAAIAGLLESAELACNQSIAENSHDIGQYDSLGFALLRMKQWDKAIAAYDKAISDRDDLTLSLYGRGLAKRAKGDRAGAAADMSAAEKNEPDIANIMKRLGAPVTA